MARVLKHAISQCRLFSLFVLFSLALYLAHAQVEELEGFEDGDEDSSEEQLYQRHQSEYKRKRMKVGDIIFHH